MRPHVVLLVILAYLISITVVYAWCGTHVPYISHASSRSTCYRNYCDTEEGRSAYYFSSNDSQIYDVKINAIVFENINNNQELRQRYEESIEICKERFLSLLGIKLTVNTTVTENQLLDVGSTPKRNLSMGDQTAAQFYKPGEMTILLMYISDYDLLGYASQYPWELDPNDLSKSYAVVSLDDRALGAQKNTLMHEIGHMLGLQHVFEEYGCAPCSETVNSPDRNAVGDYCNDTLPMWSESRCNGYLDQPLDCNGAEIGPYDELPLTNYMAYTEDSCQTLGFTRQQAARARCYLNTTLSFYLRPGPSDTVPFNVDYTPADFYGGKPTPPPLPSGSDRKIGQAMVLWRLICLTFSILTACNIY